MRIGIVEDDAPLLANLRFLLEKEPEMRLICAFGSAEELVNAQPWPKLDILMVDIELPGMSGVELIAVAKELDPTLNCLAFTGMERDEVVFEAIKAGACGYILKGGGFRELVSALHTVQQGGAPMSPGIARLVLSQFQQMACSGLTVQMDGISRRESEILQGLARGRPYKQIAAALAISPHTVNAHTKHIYEKLHVCSRTEAVLQAQRRGWL